MKESDKHYTSNEKKKETVTDNCAKQETKQHCEGKIGETKRKKG